MSIFFGVLGLGLIVLAFVTQSVDPICGLVGLLLFFLALGMEDAKRPRPRR